jgi:hypothetical protein
VSLGMSVFSSCGVGDVRERTLAQGILIKAAIREIYKTVCGLTLCLMIGD